MMSGIKINLITGEAELEEMVEKEPMEFNLDENGSVLSIKKDGVYGFETANQCKFRSTEYVETTLEIEKDLVFVNYFKQDDTMYLKDLITHQMHYAIGRERVKKEIASKDVVLGSNSNVSLYLYQKANKIVILNMNIQDEEFEEFQKPKLKPLELNQYEEYKNWAYRGTIVSEVGDYMATSSKNMDKRRLSSDQFNEPVKLDLENGNYKQIDYNAVKYNGLVISTIEKTL